MLPTNVNIAAVNPTSIDVTWPANTESDVAGYIIYYNTISGHSYSSSVDIGNVTSYTIAGLDTVANNYYITLTVYDNTSSHAVVRQLTIPQQLSNEIQTNGSESCHANEVNTVP